MAETKVKQVCIFCRQTEEVDTLEQRPWTCADCHLKWIALPQEIRSFISYLISEAKQSPQEAVAGAIGGSIKFT